MLHFMPFFFNDTATTEIYALSLHDALPISICAYLADAFPDAGLAPPSGNQTRGPYYRWLFFGAGPVEAVVSAKAFGLDRKSTRLNSSHANISYAVFCLKKKPVMPSSRMPIF